MSYIPIVGSVFGGIPYYYVFKLIFILYLINPAYTGAAHLANLIVPIITKWTSGLDKWEQQFEHFIVNNEFSKNMVKKIDNMDE